MLTVAVPPDFCVFGCTIREYVVLSVVGKRQYLICLLLRCTVCWLGLERLIDSGLIDWLLYVIYK